jgi:hypothetical protein
LPARTAHVDGQAVVGRALHLAGREAFLICVWSAHAHGDRAELFAERMHVAPGIRVAAKALLIAL